MVKRRFSPIHCLHKIMRTLVKMMMGKKATLCTFWMISFCLYLELISLYYIYIYHYSSFSYNFMLFIFCVLFSSGNISLMRISVRCWWLPGFPPPGLLPLPPRRQHTTGQSRWCRTWKNQRQRKSSTQKIRFNKKSLCKFSGL